jgi:hypothetical protein
VTEFTRARILEELYEITVQLFETLHVERYSDLKRLVKLRQNLIDRLAKRFKTDDLDEKMLSKLVRSGDALVLTCQEKLDQLNRDQKRQKKASAKIRAYRPKQSDTASRQFST